MHRNTLPALVTVATVTLALSSFNRGFGDAPPPAVTLPGARPTIDAIHYPSIQAAINALPASGGVVRLPSGKFELDEPLVLETEDVLLEGQGTGTHIHNSNTSGQPALVVRPKHLGTDAKAKLWRIELSNFRLTGNDQSGHGVVATGVNEIFIHGISVSYHGGDGIRLDHCTEDPRISDSLITYNKKTGLSLIGSHDIVVSSNHFEENYDAVQCLDSFNLCMTGNNVDDHLRNGVLIENTYGSLLTGNMIEECKGSAVVLDRDCYGITLSANVIAHDMGGGIDLRDAHGCSVTGNTFPLVRQRAVFIGPNSDRITVTGNNFCDDYVGNHKKLDMPEPASGIVLDGTSDITISGNTFAGLDTKALDVDGSRCQRINFTGNVLVHTAIDVSKLTESNVSNNIAAKSDE